MRNRKTLGEHLEQGLTNLAERGYQIQRENREYQEESISLGLISDQDKLRMLKADLYRKVRCGADVEDLINAIHVLETSIQLEHQRNNCSEAIISRLFAFLFLVGITALTLSFPITYACGHSQSRFCSNSRAITDWAVGEFQEPPKSTKPPLG